tara:strand:- start:968 stop:1444 length:477 start_codon:yes stop_codon:yes gene_type:complete
MVDKFKIYVSKDGPRKEEPVVYEDKFPEGTTIEDLKKQHGVVIWCKYSACAHNKQFEDTQRTTGTIQKNSSYKPIGAKQHVWQGLCTRDEIGVDFKEFFSSGAKFKVPACYNAATNKTGHMDFSKLLQSDGSPYGGSIESQNPEHAAFHYGTAEYGEE